MQLISPSHRPLPDDTQHSEETNIHVPGYRVDQFLTVTDKLLMCSAGMSNTDTKIEAVAETNPFMNSSNTEEELMNLL